MVLVSSEVLVIAAAVAQIIWRDIRKSASCPTVFNGAAPIDLVIQSKQCISGHAHIWYGKENYFKTNR